MNATAPARATPMLTPARFLALASLALPFLQGWPIDFDRTAPLLLLPAAWLGRRELAAGWQSLQHGSIFLRGAGMLAGLATLLAIVCSPHPAPSLVTAAGWLALATAALLAGQAARADSGSNRVLLAGIAGGAVAGTLVMWLMWLAGGRGAVPLYAHHRIFGLHALVGALATTALAVQGVTPTQRLVWLAGGAVTWGGVLWSGGRAPLLALAAGLAAWFLARPPDRKALLKVATLQLLAGLVVSAAFWSPRPELGWWHAFIRTAAAAQPGAINVSALTSTRTDFWRESAERALTSPWIGHGPDAYRFATPKLDGQQPHNLVLQLWLDLGILGAVPVLLLLGAALWTGWKISRRNEPNAKVVPWFALLVALGCAGMLDGIFYHVLTLWPALLAVGAITLGSFGHEPPPEAPRITVGARLAQAGIAGAVALLGFHAFLFQMLVVAPPPADPGALAARALRVFPSTTFGLWNWLDAWHRTHPDDALAWARWAQAHASNPPLFHIRAAQYLHARGDRAAALAELDAAEAKAHRLTRPSIAAMRPALSSVP